FGEESCFSSPHSMTAMKRGTTMSNTISALRVELSMSRSSPPPLTSTGSLYQRRASDSERRFGNVCARIGDQVREARVRMREFVLNQRFALIGRQPASLPFTFRI